MNLRTSARGQECAIRIPNYCCFNPETTVLAHYRLVGLSGAGFKSPDVCAAFACHICHDICDGRKQITEFTAVEIAVMHLEGCMRTLAYWLDRGLIVIAGRRAA